MIFNLISLGTFTFGALAFSVLAVNYWRERSRKRGVFPVFTVVCALAFALNLFWQSWLLDLVTGLIPVLLFHVVYEQSGRRPRWLPYLFYAAVPAAFTENGTAILLAAAAIGGIVLGGAGRRPAQKIWTIVLLTGLAATAIASIFQPAPWVNLFPDYFILAFFALTLYYRERLAFFDLFLKRGAFFAIGLIVLSLFFAVSTAPAWLNPLLLAVLWLAAPWIYTDLSKAIDRLWLRRPFTRVEAEQHFVRAIQTAAGEQELHDQAVRALDQIFQTTATVKDARIALAERPNGVPFLSDDYALLQSLERTLGVVLENVRFRQREEELRALAGRAELKALRAQINPHFLFNALNAIAGLIHSRPELAEETVERLAEVFRYTLRKSEKEWVRLEEEIEFVSSCLAVEQARFGDRLAVTIDVEPAAAAVQVPAMCIQPLVENAIKHGTSQVEGQGRIAVRAWVSKDRLHIEVTDNGPGFHPNRGEGHGLRNITERISGYYGVSAGLHCENMDGGARVRLELPCAS